MYCLDCEKKPNKMRQEKLGARVFGRANTKRWLDRKSTEIHSGYNPQYDSAYDWDEFG